VYHLELLLAGTTEATLRALPPASLNGNLRMTEQGETIAQKYANRLNAVYHLELLLAGTTEATLRHQYAPELCPVMIPILDQLALTSRQFYERLLTMDGFLCFFQQATPLDAIESSHIGSRPARRSGQRSLEDLRAIPWVFSWNQARFYLSGWYGVGSALEDLALHQPAVFETLCANIHTEPTLNYILSNVATSIATADEEMMRAYAELVEDETIRQNILENILQEYARTRRMLERIYAGSITERRPRLSRALNLRQNGLHLLHRQQIALLRRWRRQKHAGGNGDSDTETDQVLMQVLLTVNAIASGLRTTG
jgi:phosphoenolpyruvate carboxylase